ncbi:iron ABC transporter permease [uncultured Paenibacillus sp.]|uniref:FecCD family ABC transporter permease n=1 Tax=uncultured Paenibacillus sp. TaxID=227322 RepID=UPI0028D05EE4|nr:iron ABC transporter permease [uncultured Paenibacillus sp.]
MTETVYEAPAGLAERPRRVLKSVTVLALLLVLTIVFSIINMGIGAIRFSPWDIAASLAGIGDPDLAAIIMEYRIPRIVLAILTGAGLAISGVITQSVMRNPLAAPDTLGISGGAGLAAVIVTLLLPASAPGAVSTAAFLGGAMVAVVVYLLAHRGGVEPIRLALVGVAASAFCAAAIQLLVSKANPNVNSALIWLSGSLWGRTWDQVNELLPWIALLIPLSWALAIQLDLMNLGDNVAAGLGIRVQFMRFLLLAFSVGMTGAAVAAVGTIGFAGLISPHMARNLVGSRHKILVPTAGVLGGLLVLAADSIGRGLLPPLEIPAGLIISLIGAPYFLYLLRRESKR